MAGGNEVAAVKVGGSRTDPLSQLTSQLKQWQSGFTTWVSAQSPPVEAAIVTFTNAAQGALLGAILGTFSQDMSSLFPPNSSIDSQGMANFKKIESLAGGPAVQARNVAVITGVNAGLLCYMKRIRGAEDMEGRLVAGFGSGAMFSLVSGMGSTNKVVDAIVVDASSIEANLTMTHSQRLSPSLLYMSAAARAAIARRSRHHLLRIHHSIIPYQWKIAPLPASAAATTTTFLFLSGETKYEIFTFFSETLRRK